MANGQRKAMAHMEKQRERERRKGDTQKEETETERQTTNQPNQTIRPRRQRHTWTEGET